MTCLLLSEPREKTPKLVWWTWFVLLLTMSEALPLSLALAESLPTDEAQVDMLSKEEELEAISAEEDELQARAEVAIKEAVAGLFRRSHLPPPQDVSVSTEAQIDRPAIEGQRSVLRQIDIEVNLSFDQTPPVAIVREARQEIQRVLASEVGGDAWHFSSDEAAGKQLKASSTKSSPAPMAYVRVHADVQNSTPSTPRKLLVSQTLTLLGLVSVCLLGLLICLWIVQRLLRGLPILPKDSVQLRRRAGLRMRLWRGTFQHRKARSH